MKTETKYFFMKAIAGCLTLGFIVFLLFFFAPGAKAEDNKTIKFDDRGWPKILDEDEWRSQLIFDTVQAAPQRIGTSTSLAASAIASAMSS